ncbi:MalY/PatB family protein [Cohnella algarum]|uniref:MalY/PatB family protein n=1 Tax=Cohnella algarum TaxID=2044859 RepID=UPI0019684EA8|nr:MalY/PatB family protein [Cohnella algarum]MBN2984050.1 pyridoxal phosphate-dependent aminotransferase [Cohnella algarum]
MKEQFDRIIPREGTRSVKWDPEFLSFIKADGTLPMWVADMDFAAPEAVRTALQERVAHGVFGYPFADSAYYDAVIYWHRKRHGWSIQKDWITITPGIVPALNFLVLALTEPGEGVIIQEPVYGPFREAVESHGRKLFNNRLVSENGYYRMDLADLERKAADPETKLLILCSPHNPVGRVWKEEELRQVGDICRRHGIVVVSDEIHGDLILPGSRHIPFASLGDECAELSIVCTAPSKTFNVPGLQTSNLIIPNPELKKKLDKQLNLFHVGGANVLGLTATAAAYSPEGEQWLDELLLYLDGNAQRIAEELARTLPSVRYLKPEGGYLAWLDFRDLSGDDKQLEQRMKQEAKVLLSPGPIFGEGGEGFMRLNYGCPRSILDEALSRIGRTFGW